jgi:hypothetical protein
MSRAQITGTIVAVVVGAAIVGGVVFLGSPGEERLRRMDERRVQDLSGLAQAVDVYWTRRSVLPSSLDELRRETGAAMTLIDPATGERYEYRSIDERRFELCATFAGDSIDSERSMAGFWTHRAGRQCFQREAKEVR